MSVIPLPAWLFRRRDVGSAPRHQWYLFHLAGLSFSATARLVPRRMRFGAALHVARMLEPMIRRTDAYRRQRMTRVESAADIAASLVLHVLTRHDVPFDPVITCAGYEAFRSAFAEGNGLLVLSPHAALTLLIARYWHDDGFRPVIVSADPLMRVAGTPIVVDTVLPSPTFLLTIRTLLRSGRFVGGMPDRAVHHRKFTQEYETPNGPVIISPALMQVAVRAGSRVVFTQVHVSRGGLVATVCAPSSESAEGITREFVDFIRAHIESQTSHPQPAIVSEHRSVLPQWIQRYTHRKTVKVSSSP
jgi:hypothetical protein